MYKYSQTVCVIVTVLDLVPFIYIYIYIFVFLILFIIIVSMFIILFGTCDVTYLLGSTIIPALHQHV
jgi:hypothetical protein